MKKKKTTSKESRIKRFLKDKDCSFFNQTERICTDTQRPYPIKDIEECYLKCVDSEKRTWIAKGGRRKIFSFPFKWKSSRKTRCEKVELIAKEVSIRSKHHKERVKKEISTTEFLGGRHPNIVMFHGHFFYDFRGRYHTLCLILERMNCDGSSFLFDGLLRGKGSIRGQMTEIVLFLTMLCNGLKFIHSQGYVHADLRPSNVLINWDPKKKELVDVKITDFGLSVKLSTLNDPSSLKDYEMTENLGKYVAPELLALNAEHRVRNISVKNDVFSFGKILDEILKRKDVLDWKRYKTGLRKIRDLCVKKKPDQRPDTDPILDMLRKVLDRIPIIFSNKKKRKKSPKPKHDSK